MSTMCWRPAATALCALLALVAGQFARADWYQDTRPIMGTRVHVELWHDDAATAELLLAQTMAEMRRIEAAYSPYIEASDLSVLNREAPSGWVTVSAELFDLLRRSRQVSELTGGAFDVTYASVGRYYDYRAGKRPDPEQIRAAVEAIDYRYVEFDPDGPRVRYSHPDVYVDLGGIAKGYAVDRCVELLRRAGVSQASVAAGGDSYILGDHRGEPWTVGVRDPRQEGRMAAVLPLMDTAVSTSGDYERFFEEDGVRYHHILDPDTGASARRSWSVTVLGPETLFTDALSTSVFVLGPEAGLALIDRLPGIDAIVIDAEGRLRYSADLAPLVGAEPGR
ncbi:MAG: FAD:protein FMN transferase [Pseudomonadales bacterium]